MSATGVTGPGRTEGNDVAAITAKTRDRLPTQTELENEAGRKAVEHHTAQRSVPVASNKANGAAPVSPGAFSFSALPDTGIIEAVAPCAKQHSKKQVGPDSDHGTESDTSLSLDFLDDFFGSDKRHLVAIKKPRTKGESPIIKAHHFDAADRDGQQKSANAALLASIFISARTRSRGRFTRKPPRVTSSRHAIFGSTLTPDLANRLRLNAMQCLPNSQPSCPRGSRDQTG